MSDFVRFSSFGRVARLALPVLALCAAALTAAPVMASTTVANPQPGDIHYLATSGGLENPEVIFAFNPQPDPPGDQTYLDFTNPAAPSLLLPAVSQAEPVEFLVGFPGGGFAFSNIPSQPTTDSNGNAMFQFTATAGDGSVFQVTLDFSGYVGGWSSFNPQPDPPGDVLAGAFSADPGATLHIDQIVNGSPVALSFSEIPEPASLGLLLTGAVGLAARRRRAPAA